MKTRILTLVALFAFATISTAVAQEKKVNVKESKITWTGHKVIGQHEGTINIKEGTLKFKDGKLVDGMFTIDMTTINTTDLSGESKGNLDGHLKSDDFFGVNKFPTSKIEFTKVVPQGPGKYKVTGNLTIKGISKEVKFIANLDQSGTGVTGSADVTIDRSEYDIKYGSGSFFDNLGDKTIYDDFSLNVSLVAKK